MEKGSAARREEKVLVPVMQRARTCLVGGSALGIWLRGRKAVGVEEKGRAPENENDVEVASLQI